MCERSQVTARAHGPPAGDARMHPAIQQRDQVLECRAPDAGVALGQHVGTQQHRGAHRPYRQWIAHAGGVTAHQIQLQGSERGARDCGLRQGAEARIDSVHWRVALGVAIDDRPRVLDELYRRRCETHLSPVVGNRDELFERQRGAVEKDHREICCARKKVEYFMYEHCRTRRTVG